MEYLFCIFAYLLGSVPFGLIVGRLVKGIDVREHGSGNLGATNVFRVIGRRWGIFVLFLDALKGYLAVALPNAILMGDISPLALILLALAAIAGHAFPVWLKFKGGKGVATSLGVFLAIAFKPTLVTFMAFLIVFAMTHIISISSLSAAFLFPFVIFWTHRQLRIFPYLFTVSLLLLGFIIYTHRANIGRLLRGEEKKLF